MSLIQTATRRRVTVAMVTISFCLFGVIALKDLKVNLLPDLSYPTLTVRTEYSGAAPTEIENLVTQPVEEAVGVVKNMRKVRSVSRTGQSDVTLEFAWGTNMDLASIEVRDKMEVLQLPLEAKKPVLLRFDPSTEPIIRLALTTGEAGSTVGEADLKQLRRYAEEDLKKRLEPTPGVAAVKAGGGLEDQIQVDIDERKLAQLGLGVNEVIDRLRAENVNVSGGRIDEGSQRYLVRTVNQFATVEEMQELLVRVSNNIPVKLKDVAEVHQGFKEREAIIRVDGREAVELAIYKEGDANTVSVAELVKKQLERLKDNMPQGVAAKIVEDQSIFIRNALHSVRSAAFEGGVLAILIIFFFLKDGWSTFVISLSLPISIIATFFFMGQAGLSLNVMSLGGLALATGMVVDDSIVVLENVARMRERGMGALEAAIKGTTEVGMAVTASTLTTVAVFFPLVFVQGVAGQLFRDQALTVTIAMIISLIVAMTVVPALASYKGRKLGPVIVDDAAPEPLPLPHNKVLRGLVRASRGTRWFLFHFLPYWVVFAVSRVGRGLSWLVGKTLVPVGNVVLSGYNRAADRYHALLPRALDRPGLVLGVAAALFVGTLALLPTLGLDLIPQLQQGTTELTVKLPPGTPLAETDALVRRLQAAHAKDADIETIHGVSGTGTRLDANPTESGENVGKLTIQLKPGAGEAGERRANDAFRATLVSTPGVEAKFSRPELFSFATPLEIEIAGYDMVALQHAGQDLTSRLRASDRYTDVKSTVEEGYPEIQIRFDADRAAALGLTTRQISDQIVRKVRGEVATRYSFRDRKIDVLVRAAERDRASVDDVRNLIVNPQSDRPVTLAAVADVITTEGPAEIHRADQQRVAVVSASLAYGDLGSAVDEIRGMLRDKPLGAGLDVSIGGQSEELEGSVQSLIFALTLAIFLVYLVMASQFESLLHPFVIMFTIPLAMVGAVLALKISGRPLSVVVFIGLILLVGIVVKNAIVLIDRVNQLRHEGMDRREALCAAAESRLRPIAMTTLCTLLGFAPLALGTGEGNEVRAPMAITVIGGLLVSTLLTLVVIPVVYELLDRKPIKRARGHETEQELEGEASEPLLGHE